MPSIAGRYAKNSLTASIFLPCMRLIERVIMRKVLISGERASRYGTAARLSFSEKHRNTDTAVRVRAWRVRNIPDAVLLRSVKRLYAAVPKNAAGAIAASPIAFVHIRAEMLLRTKALLISTSVRGVGASVFSAAISHSL